MELEPKGNESKKQSSAFVWTGIAIGIGVGVALGVALENMATGIAIGAGVGMLFGIGISQRNRNEE